MLFSPILPFLAPVADPALHIPDGFLSLSIAIIFWIAAVILIALAVRRTQGELGERQVPLMGIMAAFIFAAQMINFPVAGGTSGHLLGGTLAAIVLGPWAAMLVMASVVGLQGLLFQDGGLLVMGTNIFNMGLLTALISYGLYRGVASRSRPVRLGVAGVAAWLSVMGAALLTSIQLWLSGTSPAGVVIPAMLGVHVLIGLGEALITGATLGFITQTRPDLLEAQTVAARGGRGWVVAGLFVALVVVLFSPYASANPDGLARVAEEWGFLHQSVTAPYQLLPNYTIPFLSQSSLSKVVAGAIGVLIVAGIGVAVGGLLRQSQPAPTGEPATPTPGGK